MVKRKLFLLSVVISLLLGFLSSFFNCESLDVWYNGLVKSSLTPPNWFFSVVWFVLYVILGISFYLIISNNKFINNKYYRSALAIFFIQYFLNIFWSFLFFYLRSPFLALLEIIVLMFFTMINIYYFYRLRPLAGYLLLPYALWIIFALYLNFIIYQFN